MLTHDPKFDVPLLEVALRLPEVAYVGAMGSRRTHEDREARLREAGLTDEELARLSSPIGLDLGARTPEETAISIAAEIIAGRWGGSGSRLGRTRRAHPPRLRPRTRWGDLDRRATVTDVTPRRQDLDEHDERSAGPPARRPACLDGVRRARRQRRGAGPARDPPQLAALAAAGLARRRRRPRSTTSPRPAPSGVTRRCRRPSTRVEDELRRTAQDGDLVLAVTDAQTRILWTYGGRVMRRKAESVNFVPAARWDDESVGTNALDLANRLAPAEHGLQRRALRADRAQLGVLGRAGERPGHRRPARRDRPVDDLGPHPPDRPRHRARAGPPDRDRDAALGDASRPAATSTVRPASSSGCSATPRPPSTAAGCCSTAGRPRSWRILALHPDGLSLDRLHALVYGDQAVTFSTLKAEVSHLRAALGGQLASRPYRLTLPVATDIDDVLDALRRVDAAAAITATAATCCPAPSRPRSSSWASTSPSPCARRCWPTPSPMP